MSLLTPIQVNAKKASFWKRLVASLIDTVLLTIVILVLRFSFQFSDIVEAWIYFFLFLLYNILMDYYLQGTLGKGLLKLEIVKVNGNPPGFANCFYRNIGKYISLLPLGYGYFRILAPHRNQTIHDELGNCLVINGK